MSGKHSKAGSKAGSSSSSSSSNSNSSSNSSSTSGSTTSTSSRSDPSTSTPPSTSSSTSTSTSTSRSGSRSTSRSTSRTNSPRNANASASASHSNSENGADMAKQQLRQRTNANDRSGSNTPRVPRETSDDGIVSAEEVQRRKEKIKKWMEQEDRERDVRREKIAATTAARSDIGLRVVLCIWLCMIVLIFYQVLSTIQAGRTVVQPTTPIRSYQAPFRPFK